MWESLLLGAVVGTCAALAYQFFRSRSKILYEHLAKKIMIFEKNKKRFLVFTHSPGVIQSAYDCQQPIKIVLHYQKLLIVCLLCLPARPQRIALMGLGGGNLSMHLRRLCPDALIEHFEKEPRMLDYAQRFFGLRTDDKMVFHFGDAIKAFETEHFEPYDLIIIDLFDGATPPPQLSSRDFCYTLKRVLSAHGALLINTMGPEKNTNVYRNIFEHVARCSWDKPLEYNHIVWAAHIPPEPPDFENRAHLLALQGLNERDIKAISRSLLGALSP